MNNISELLLKLEAEICDIREQRSENESYLAAIKSLSEFEDRVLNSSDDQRDALEAELDSLAERLFSA